MGMCARGCWRLGAALLAAAVCFSFPRGASAAGELELPPKPPLRPEAKHADIARVFAKKLPDLHLEGVALDDVIARRALLLYLTALDSDHSVFLASDIATFTAGQNQLDDRLKAGDVEFAFQVMELFKERMRDRYEFIRGLLAKGFDLNQEESLAWKRRGKDTPWPADARERDEIWRKKIKDQYIRRVLANEMVLAATASGEGGATGVTTTVTTTGVTTAAGTNATPTTQPGRGETNVTANAVPAAQPVKVETPEAYTLNEYKQFLMVLHDNDAEWVLQLYLSSVARAYDPHSDFMSESTAENFDISMKLSLVGVGAVLTSEDGAAKVVKIVPGGPADRDGRLKPGDKIIAVGQGDKEPESVVHLPLNRTVSLIRGEKGSKVVLTVIPASSVSGAKAVRIDIVRDDVRLEDEEAKGEVRRLQDAGGRARKFGVIRLEAFYMDMKGRYGGGNDYRSSTRDVARRIAEMKAEGVEGICLDLRGNGGGALQEAVDMTGLFIKRGPVVQVKDRRRTPVLRDDDASIAYSGPMVVLVNRLSASASEILAAALQDYGRAVIVGDTTTHGKGTVQSVVAIQGEEKDAKASLKITTATFYRFTGASTQVKGVSSDVVVRSVLDVMEIGESFLDYALPWSRIEPVKVQEPRQRPLLTDMLLGPAENDGSTYQEVKDLGPAIERLRKKSSERRTGDPRHVARAELIEKFAERQRNDALSLKLSERRRLAAEEQRLYDLQQEERDDGTGGGKPDAAAKQKDLVMEEALHILSDLSDILAEKPAGAVAE